MLSEEARTLKLMLDAIELTAGACVLRKEIDGELVAVILPSLRNRMDDASFTDVEAAALWAKCREAVEEFVHNMRFAEVVAPPPSEART